ncbi:MAG: AAA family ATPase [Bacteroidota bacterium]
MARLLGDLSQGLYERETAVRLALLTAIAGESLFLLGPPGVGKSLIARRLKYAFRDGKAFEYLMSKFSTPDEIFGPISIKKLKEEDKYERLTENYLPGANVVFLDEIWKAGPAIQNALLTILNERIYRNGENEIAVEVRAIITASNELPPPDQQLAPIWDRFLLRLEIGGIRKMDNFLRMVVDTQDVYEDNIPQELKLSQSELEKWSAKIDEIEIPAEVLNTLQLIRTEIDRYNTQPNNAAQPLLIYDRRWKKMVHLLRTSAFLNGRGAVDLMDCFLLPHGLWNRPGQLEKVAAIVVAAVRQHGYNLAINLQSLKKEVADFEADVVSETQIVHRSERAQLLPVVEMYYRIEEEVKQFKGRLISIEQFRELDLEDYRSLNFYDEDKNLVNRIKARKGREENQLEVFFNGSLLSFPLETQLQEQREIIFKKPHRVVVAFFDQRLEKLRHYIQTQLEKIEQGDEGNLAELQQHLFVPAERAEVVRANLEEVREDLQQIQLRLDKLHYAYAADPV